MANNTVNNKLIIRNTIMLYVRMALSMFVALFTSRIVLNTLGVEDYGINGVVGGVVSFWGFLNSSMSAATSRFITFEMGRGNERHLNVVFNCAFVVHLCIAVVVVALAETIGLWFLNNKLVIPSDRMMAAQWVYQLSIFSMVIGITQVPYTASIISHDRMDIYAYTELANILLKLLVVYLLVIGDFDKLILYSILTTVISTGVVLFYRYFCFSHFEECRFKRVWNATVFRQMLTFSGWDFLGNLSVTIRGQGIGMLINIFYGVVVNAASGIAGQVQGVVMAFASNVLMAVKPQIIKSYARGDYERTETLITYASLGIFYLLMLLTVPIILETHFILQLWLGIVPEYSVLFCRFVLIFNVFSALAMLVLTVSHAANKNKYPSLVNGIMYLSSLPVSYFVFCFFDLVWFPYFYNVLTMVGGVLFIGWLASRYLNVFSFKGYVLNILLRNILIIIFIIGIVLYVQSLMGEESWKRFWVTCIISTVLILFLGYVLGINREARCLIYNFISNKFKIRQ